MNAQTVLLTRLICIQFLLLFLLTGLQAAQGEWELVKDEDNIQIFLRDVSYSDIQEYKGVIELNTSVDSIVKVWDDTLAMQEWFHRSRDTVLIEKNGFSERYNYQVSVYPFPASNRDIITKMKLSQTKGSDNIHISVQSAPTYCKDKDKEVCRKVNLSDLIHIRRLKGYFLIERLATHKVRVTWQMHTELEGSLPSWMVNQKIVDIPFESFKSLRELVKRQKYQKARLVYDDKGRIEGFHDFPYTGTSNLAKVDTF